MDRQLKRILPPRPHRLLRAFAPVAEGARWTQRLQDSAPHTDGTPDSAADGVSSDPRCLLWPTTQLSSLVLTPIRTPVEAEPALPFRPDGATRPVLAARCRRPLRAPAATGRGPTVGSTPTHGRPCRPGRTGHRGHCR